MGSFRSIRQIARVALLCTLLIGALVGSFWSMPAVFADEMLGADEAVDEMPFGDDNLDLPAYDPVFSPDFAAGEPGIGYSDAALESNNRVVSWAVIKGFAEETMNWMNANGTNYYRWAGETKEGGFDCSGFVKYVYENTTGISLYHSSASMYVYNCTPIPREEAQPGDLVFATNTYAGANGISHVEIYCGKDETGTDTMIGAGGPVAYHRVSDLNATLLFGRVNGLTVLSSEQGDPDDNDIDNDASSPDQRNMYRLYNPYSGEHLYSESLKERTRLTALGWEYEGVAWVAPVLSDTPVYRLYNPYSGDHHYTLDLGERDYLVRLGWNAEGIGWYSDDAEGMPLLRLFNPYLFVGSHLYTLSSSEYDDLIVLGWQGESVGWYGLIVTDDDQGAVQDNPDPLNPSPGDSDIETPGVNI